MTTLQHAHSLVLMHDLGFTDEQIENYCDCHSEDLEIVTTFPDPIEICVHTVYETVMTMYESWQLEDAIDNVRIALEEANQNI